MEGGAPLETGARGGGSAGGLLRPPAGLDRLIHTQEMHLSAAHNPHWLLPPKKNKKSQNGENILRECRDGALNIQKMENLTKRGVKSYLKLKELDRVLR